MTTTLLRHLADFGSLFSQGELLCTQGLCHLLKNPRASERLAAWLGEVAPGWSPCVLKWRAEEVQTDGGRPDLVGRDTSGHARVKVEAKLGALLTPEQVRSYALDLGTDGLVVLLVPRTRLSDITVIARTALPGPAAISGPSAWRSETGCMVVVVAWQDVFAALREADLWPSGGDLDQLEGLYLGLTSNHVADLADLADLEQWRPREKELQGLLDHATRALQSELLPLSKALPFGREPVAEDSAALPSHGYLRRYVCDQRVCFSVGLRDPFRGHKSPVWLRLHHDIPNLQAIRSRMHAAFASRLVDSDRHLWLELDLPLGVSGEQMIEVLVAQCREAWRHIMEPVQ